MSTRFDQLAADAPGDTERRDATSVATALRGYLFALEAERLLRDAPTPPTADQLAAADTTRRARTTDLDTGIAAMRTHLGPDANTPTSA